MPTRARPKPLTAVTVGRVEKHSVGKQVVGRVLELIRAGNLRPGDRLPPERELTEIFGISRPSLREAMRALATLGIVESRHGGGAFVTDLEARTLLAPLDFYLSLSKVNFDEAFDSRRVIEMEIVRRAASKASRSEIKDLKDMIEAHETVLNDPVGFLILDARFHERLSEIAGNAILQRIAYGLYHLGLDFHHFRRRASADPGLISRSAKDHAAIAAAIAEHDAPAAAAAIARHIKHIEDSTRRIMADGGNGESAVRRSHR